jgi:predicted DNA-binding transcriptional regulator AlpA
VSRRILRPKQTQAKLQIGHSKFYADIRKGILPPLVRLGPNSVGHFEDEIDAYLEKLSRERDEHRAKRIETAAHQGNAT